MTQTTNISRTEVADILKDVLPTYVVKRIASYHAHPLAGLSREMAEQYFKLNIIGYVCQYFKYDGSVRHERTATRYKSDYIRRARRAHNAGSAFSLCQLEHNMTLLYLNDRRINILRIDDQLSADRHYLSEIFPLRHRYNTKKEILDFAAKQSIKLSMSWTKTKMLMVFNSKYGA